MIPEARPASRTRTLYLGVIGSIFFLTLLLGAKTPPFNDGKQIIDSAENVVYQGSFGISLPDGKYFYNPRPMFVSLVHVPGVLLRRGLTALFHVDDAVTRIMTSHLVPAAILGFLGALLLRFLMKIGVGVLAASLSTAVFAFSTIVFVYGRVVWADILQVAAFWGFFSELILASQDPNRRRALKIGIWAGLLVNTKYTFVLALPGAGLFLALQTWPRLKTRGVATLFAWTAVAALPFALFILWSNHHRWGSAFYAGYAGVPFQEAVFWGLYSLLFSYGKGLFLYNPVLALAFHNDRLPSRFWLAVALVCGPVVLLYAKASDWAGDWSWGPRYIAFVIPVLMVPVAVRLNIWIERRRRGLVGVFAALAIAGVCVQMVGAGVYWDHFIRLSQATAFEWLGNPNRAGNYSKKPGPHCDPCYEDLHNHTYTPAFQPIEGHYWLLKHWFRGDSWEACQHDMPWRRYTSLPLSAPKTWCSAIEVDWWYRMFRKGFPVAGVILLGCFLVGTSGCLWLWIRGARRYRALGPPLP
jgi:hypothetical protein